MPPHAVLQGEAEKNGTLRVFAGEAVPERWLADTVATVGDVSHNWLGCVKSASSLRQGFRVNPPMPCRGRCLRLPNAVGSGGQHTPPLLRGGRTGGRGLGR